MSRPRSRGREITNKFCPFGGEARCSRRPADSELHVGDPQPPQRPGGHGCVENASKQDTSPSLFPSLLPFPSPLPFPTCVLRHGGALRLPAEDAADALRKNGGERADAAAAAACGALLLLARLPLPPLCVQENSPHPALGRHLTRDDEETGCGLASEPAAPLNGAGGAGGRRPMTDPPGRLHNFHTSVLQVVVAPFRRSVRPPVLTGELSQCGRMMEELLNLTRTRAHVVFEDAASVASLA